MSSKRFMVRNRAGEVSGPFSSGDLVRLAADGSLTPNCAIQQEGGTGWHPATKVKGLPFAADAVPAAAPVAPAAPAAPASPAASAPATELWWVSSGGQPSGPMSADDVRAAFTAAGSPAGWQVVRHGTTTWMPIGASGLLGAPTASGPSAPGAPAGGAGNSQALAKSLARDLPSAFLNPMAGFATLSDRYPSTALLAFSAVVNLAANLLIALFVILPFRKFLEFGDMAELVIKVVIVFTLPFLALGLSNFGMRKAALQGSTRPIGSDALVAMLAILPAQLALIAFFLIGLNEASGALLVLGLLLSVTLVYAINASDNPGKEQRLVFLAPLQILVAAGIAAVMFREMLPPMGPR